MSIYKCLRSLRTVGCSDILVHVGRESVRVCEGAGLLFLSLAVMPYPLQPQRALPQDGAGAIMRVTSHGRVTLNLLSSLTLSHRCYVAPAN